MGKYKKFYNDARERVLTAAATVAGAIGSVELFVAQTGIGEDHLVRVASYGVVATVLNVIKVLAARKVGDPDSGSLNRVEHGATVEDLSEALKEKNAELDAVLAEREDDEGV